jgi:hypothetical protein
MSERSDALYDFVCTICNQTFDRIPPDALEISRSPSSRITFHQFNSEMHALKNRKKQLAALPQEQK